MIKHALLAAVTVCCAAHGGSPKKEVLLDGSRTTNMRPHKWREGDGYLEVGEGGLSSSKQYGHLQLHVEWKPPVPAKGSDQGRGNSGVFLGRYELQVLDCYENSTYCTGQTGSIYGLYPPLVNACLPPEKWTTYEILFNGPSYKGKKLVRPPRLTALHNGVVIHHDVVIWGQFQWKDKWNNNPHGPEGLSFQNHGNPVRYRSIWVIPREAERDERMRMIDMARYMHQLRNQKWVMRAPDQPKPKIVTPGAKPGDRPSDAMKLTTSSFGGWGSSRTSRKSYPNAQFHLEWKRSSPITLSAFGLELKLPSERRDYNSTDLIFSRGEDGGTPYVIVTVLHNGVFYERRAQTTSRKKTTKIGIKGQPRMRNMWIRAVGGYPGHDANRPVIGDYEKQFEASQ